MPSGRMAWQMLRVMFSVGLVALVASRVDLGQMSVTLAGANLWLVLMAFLVVMGSWVAGSYKWRLLLRALGPDLPVGYLLSLNLAGLFYSLFLPGQIGGEVVKGIKLARHGVSGVAATATIGLDRLTGLIALALVALGGLAFGPETAAGPSMRLAAVAVLFASLSPLLVLPVLSRLFPAVDGGRGWLASGPVRLLLNAVGPLTAAFLQYRRTPAVLALALFWALVVQGLIIASNYLAALSLGLEIPILGLAWVVALTSVLHLIPLAFAGLGVREGAYVILLQGYGVSDADGLGLALLVFGLIVAQGLAGGLVELADSLGFSVKRSRLGEAKGSEPAAGEEPGMPSRPSVRRP